MRRGVALTGTLPFVLLSLLVVACGVVLWLAPVRRYVVTCTRTDAVSSPSCVLGQQKSREQVRFVVPASSGDVLPAASVRVIRGRRGPTRVLMYLRAAGRDYFAAEFEGSDAGDAAYAATRRLNTFFSHPASGTVQITTAAPEVLPRLAWFGLLVTGMLVIVGYRSSQRQAQVAR